MDDENPIPVSHFIQGVYTVIKATKYCNSLCGVYRTGGEGLEDSQKECLETCGYNVALARHVDAKFWADFANKREM